MTNLYWPIFKNLESEFNSLMFDIHVDDHQLNVYSMRISDLIIRSTIEIESLAKDLYKREGGTKSAFLKFDEDCLKYLDGIYGLSDKVVVISSVNCFTTNRTLTPFAKKEDRTGTSRKTFSWNNSYQNLKHDRAKSLPFGTLKYLFDAMAALFLLNIYFKNETFYLDKDGTGTSFPYSQGSDIFSIKLYTSSLRGKVVGGFKKTDDFKEHVYRIEATEDTAKTAREALDKFEEQKKDLLLSHLLNELERNPQIAQGGTESIKSWVVQERLKVDGELIIKTIQTHGWGPRDFMQLTYEAIIVKNET
jgi:hypothetical protein